MENLVYNKEDVFNEKILPLIMQLKTVCNEEKMPMFVSVAVSNGPEGTEYKNDAVLASTGVHLEDNRIANIMLSMNGLVVDYPEYIKKDLRELEEYAERSKVKVNEIEVTGEDFIKGELTEDQFVAFQKIAMAGAKAVLSDEMKGTPMDNKYWEE